MYPIDVFSPGFAGQHGHEGAKGEMGLQGPPGRRVSTAFSDEERIRFFYQGERGRKGESGSIQKLDFNSTHTVMMGPPGLPGSPVGHSY